MGDMLDLGGRDATTTGRSGTGVEAHLDECVDRTVGRMGACVEALCDPDRVDGVHDVGVRGDARRLVGLDLSDEVPAQAYVSGEVDEGGGLVLGLLVPVLADVTDAELG